MSGKSSPKAVFDGIDESSQQATNVTFSAHQAIQVALTGQISGEGYHL